MATPTARGNQKTPQKQAPQMQEVVDPRWLLKALAVAVAAAAFCGYLSVCLLIYQGSWQLLLHPSPSVEATPAVPFQSLRFDAGVTGMPRLTAWWIPAESANARTILFLHDGSGSLSNSVSEFTLLHRAGLNVFAMDYRGFGHSEPPHPTEARMLEDAEAALTFLVNTRHLSPGSVVPMGEGLGAVLALRLSNSHPELAAVIAENPDPNAFDRATKNGRSHFLPMRALVQEHFDVTSALNASHKPKLLLADTPALHDSARIAVNQALFRTAPDPKLSVTFASGDASDFYVQTLTRFLDEYVH